MKMLLLLCSVSFCSVTQESDTGFLLRVYEFGSCTLRIKGLYRVTLYGRFNSEVKIRQVPEVPE